MPRTTALAVIRAADRLLLSEVPDAVKNVVGYRPLGGTIEFGERGHQTVVREIREEIGAELVQVRYLGTLENIFEYLGRPGHEIALVYTADLREPRVRDQDVIEAHDDAGGTFRCFWKPLDDFRRGVPLYPDGLLEMLTRSPSPRSVSRAGEP